MFNKYKYIDIEIEQILKSIVVIVDSREKNNIHIIDWFDKKKISYIIKKLDQGDYSFYIPKNDELSIFRDIYFDKDIVIERKASLEELSGNLSKERDRFEKELCLNKGKMYLLIENSNYGDICEGNYKTEYNKKSYLGSIHTFSHRYEVPFMFMPENKYSPIYIYFTFYYYLREMLKNNK